MGGTPAPVMGENELMAGLALLVANDAGCCVVWAGVPVADDAIPWLSATAAGRPAYAAVKPVDAAGRPADAAWSGDGPIAGELA